MRYSFRDSINDLFSNPFLTEPVPRDRGNKKCVYSRNEKCTKKLGTCNGYKRCKKKLTK